MLFKEIIVMRGLDKYNLKLIRHTISRDYIQKIIENGNLELYQSYQKAHVFKKCDYIITFTNLEGTKSLLHGVYKINGREQVYELPECIRFIKVPESWGEGPYNKYFLENDNRLDDLKGRIVIDWGTATLAWHQRKLDKEIVEIFSVGFVKSFHGYQNVILSFEELNKITKNPDAHRQWKNALSSVYGIYLILDKEDGRQYVGSAYGKDGIWGRWSTYTRTKHGNNKLLMELLYSDPERYKKFQFSILDILPSTSMKDEVIQLETTIKSKLGSNVFGLNAN